MAIGKTDRTSVKLHLRHTFIAGLFSFVPLAVTAFIIWWIDHNTRGVSDYLFHRHIPFFGVILAIAAIYATGLITTSLMGQFLLATIDRQLIKLPFVRQVYLSWKQIALTPGGTGGTFSRVVLIPDETGQMQLLGFTSGRIIPASPPMYCVFVPSSPNPLTGRLYFVLVDKCTLLDLSPEEGFKIILSTGNHLPPLIPAGTSQPEADAARVRAG